MANTVQVKKANRVITIPEEQVNSYLQRGYDQVEGTKVVKHATGGKTVSIAEFNKILKELEEAKVAKGNEGEVKELKEEIKVLEQENERLDKLVKQLRNSNKR